MHAQIWQQIHIAARSRASRSEPLSQMGSLMSEQLRDDQTPGLTQDLVSLLGDVHLLISDGHYKAAGEQLSLAVQTPLYQQAAIHRAVPAAAKNIENASDRERVETFR